MTVDDVLERETLDVPASSDDVEPPIDRRLVAAMLAMVVGLLAWLLVRLLTSDWLAVGDYRTLQLRVSDVFGPHTPLLGVYSRFQWNHPGPMILYLLAVPYRLFGSNDVSLLIGALLVNLATIATAVWIGIRAGRRAFVLTCLFIALLVFGMNPAGLADPWNPRLMVLSILTCFLAAWRTAFGDRIAAIALVVWGSFAVQCHLGSALPVATLVVIAILALAVRTFGGTSRRRDLVTLALSLGIGLMCWLPPIVEQIVHSDGNMSRIVSFLQHPPAESTGFRTGAQIVLRYLSIPGDWVRGLEPVRPTMAFDTHGWAIPWAFIALLVATWWAWRRRWRVEGLACLLAIAVDAASLVAASRIVQAPVPYLLRWMWPVAAMTWMAVALVLLRQLCRTRFGARHGATVVLTTTIAVLVLMIPRGIDLRPLRVTDAATETILAVTPAIMDAIGSIDGTIWVSNGLGVDGCTALEVISRGERIGLDIRRDPEWGYIVGPHRTIERVGAARELQFITGDVHLYFDDDPDYVKIASYDPRTQEQRDAMQALFDRHTASVDTTGMTPIQAFEARDAVFSAWIVDELRSERQSADFVEWWRRQQEGVLLNVYLSVGPPRPPST